MEIDHSIIVEVETGLAMDTDTATRGETMILTLSFYLLCTCIDEVAALV